MPIQKPSKQPIACGFLLSYAMGQEARGLLTTTKGERTREKFYVCHVHVHVTFDTQ